MVGLAVGLKVEVIISDGSKPVGRGIGPALEALDVLAVLKNKKNAPKDLKDKAILIAGAILELGMKAPVGKGQQNALKILKSKKAFKKFVNICKAQGNYREPEIGKLKHDVLSTQSGLLKGVDNRRLSKIAKLSGAPQNPGAGVLFLSPFGEMVEIGQPIFSIYAESKGELDYALNYLKSEPGIINIQPI